MSDPRIYHRVGPVAPEGRQIYDDIRRRDEGLTSAFNSEISTVNGEITALDGTVTTLEDQVNALAVTPVSVGTSTDTSPITINSTGIGTLFSELSVTPVVAKPFMIKPNGYLLDITQNLTYDIKWYETTSGSDVFLTTLASEATSPIFTTYAPIPLFHDTLVANTGTTTRTFELYIHRTTATSATARWSGTSKAFQWTVG